jgi:hypothetical protein
LKTEEEEKGSPVFLSDTVANPGAVVIEGSYAVITVSAVLAP